MAEHGFEDGVGPVEGCLEVEIVPETVAEDEGVGAGGFSGWEDGAETGELFGGDGEADHLLDCEDQIKDEWMPEEGGGKPTHDVHCIGWASEALRIILENVGGSVDSLDGAGFQVELVIAEAVFPAASSSAS